MLEWLVLTSVKLLKSAIVLGLAITTPPGEGAEPGPVPGLEPRCHGTIILIRHAPGAPLGERGPLVFRELPT